jgi:hypothetical protein
MLSSADAARLERILARLEPDDAAWLSELVEPPSHAARRRLAKRDAAVRQAWTYFAPQLPRTVAAQQLANAFSRYLTSRWAFDQHLASLPDDVDELRRLLHRVARANDGRPLGWRQILNLVDGHRG